MTKRKPKYTGPEVSESGPMIRIDDIDGTLIPVWREDLPELIRRLEEFAPKPEYDVEVRGNITSYTPKHPKRKAKAKPCQECGEAGEVRPDAAGTKHVLCEPCVMRILGHKPKRKGARK